MRSRITPLLVICLLFSTFSLRAQDDLLSMITDSSASSEPVIATFKSSRIINAQTVETVRKHDLDFRVGHRFGNIGKASGGGIHTLYGMDQSVDINIAFEYGITNNLTAGFSRSKLNESYQGSLKYRVMRQTENNKVPVSITLYNSTVANTNKVNDDSYTNNTAHRFSYVTQAIIAKKFNDGFSFEIVPSFIHRNWVPFGDENDNFSIGAGGRLKLTKRSAIVGDVFYTFSKYRNARKSTYLMPPLSLGWEVETGGHVFTLMFSNASGLLENDFLVNTTDSWGKGGFKFSFIISRTFTVGS